jgi:hypothetical protein
MRAEIPLQVHIFTGALVDTRTDAQKERDEKVALPQPIFMFSQSELAQIDRPVTPARAWQNEAAPAPLELATQDIRSEEERERDRRQAETSLLTPLFPDIDKTEQEYTGNSTESQLAETTRDPATERITALPLTPEAALAELALVVTDISQTIAATPDVLLSQSICLAQALISAHTTGVSTQTMETQLQRLKEATPPHPYPFGMASNHRHPKSSDSNKHRLRVPTYFAQHYPAQVGKRAREYANRILV